MEVGSGSRVCGGELAGLCRAGSLTAGGASGARPGVRFLACSAGAERPAGWWVVESEDGEPGEVDGGGE